MALNPSKHFSCLFVKLGNSPPRPLLFPFGEVSAIFPLSIVFFLREIKWGNSHWCRQVSSFLIPLAEVSTNSLFYFLLCSLSYATNVVCSKDLLNYGSSVIFSGRFLWFLREKHSALGHNSFIQYVLHVKQLIFLWRNHILKQKPKNLRSNKFPDRWFM